MGIVALVLLAWQAARIPLEGSVATSLAHARSVRGLEESLGLDVEGPVVRFASTPPYESILEWMYTGIHTPALFGFMAAACVYAPERYVTAAHDLRRLVPAGAPRHRPVSPCAPALDLGARLRPGARPGGPGGIARHVDPQLDRGHRKPALRLRRLHRRSLALAGSPLAHRLGRGGVSRAGLRRHRRNRQPLRPRLHRRHAHVRVRDCGGRALARPIAPVSQRPPARTVLSVSLGFAMIAWGLVSLQLISPGGWRNVVAVLVLAGGIAAVLAPRWSAKEPVAESSG